jgi:hypothetical protein
MDMIFLVFPGISFVMRNMTSSDFASKGLGVEGKRRERVTLVIYRNRTGLENDFDPSNRLKNTRAKDIESQVRHGREEKNKTREAEQRFDGKTRLRTWVEGEVEDSWLGVG